MFNKWLWVSKPDKSKRAKEEELYILSLYASSVMHLKVLVNQNSPYLGKI